MNGNPEQAPADLNPGVVVDVMDHLQRREQAEAEALITNIAGWDEARLANELGDNAQAQKNLDLVDKRGLRADFIAALTTRHGKTLADWLKFGGKKGRAAKNFATWHE
jgi:hypothetical protein